MQLDEDKGMKIVIDISEDFYADCKEWVADYCANIEQAIIAEGIPLPRGEWKLDSLGAYCSECGIHPDYSSNYCPNCGASMQGEVEE